MADPIQWKTLPCVHCGADISQADWNRYFGDRSWILGTEGWMFEWSCGCHDVIGVTLVKKPEEAGS